MVYLLYKKGGGTPNPFTVRQMPFFPGFNSKVCRKNKVSEGISKKGVGDPNPFTVRQKPFFRSFISKVCRKNKVSEGISKKFLRIKAKPNANTSTIGKKSSFLSTVVLL